MFLFLESNCCTLFKNKDELAWFGDVKTLSRSPNIDWSHSITVVSAGEALCLRFIPKDPGRCRGRGYGGKASGFSLDLLHTRSIVSAENTLHSILSANNVTNQILQRVWLLFALPNSPSLYFFSSMYEGKSSRRPLLQSLQRPAVCQHVQDAAGHALLHERLKKRCLNLNWAVL